MERFAKALQTVADDLDAICQKNKTCDTCPFYKSGRECSPNIIDELVRNAKEMENRCDTLLESAQALQKVLGVK